MLATEPTLPLLVLDTDKVDQIVTLYREGGSLPVKEIKVVGGTPVYIIANRFYVLREGLPIGKNLQLIMSWCDNRVVYTHWYIDERGYTLRSKSEGELFESEAHCAHQTLRDKVIQAMTLFRQKQHQERLIYLNF